MRLRAGSARRLPTAARSASPGIHQSYGRVASGRAEPLRPYLRRMIVETHRRLVLAAMCVGMFFILLDVTIVNVALPAIGSGLHAGPRAQVWIVDADTLVFACLLLSGGALGDRYGRKRLTLIGLAVFGVGSLLCAAAASAAALIS